MARADAKTVVLADGLRYKSKVSVPVCSHYHSFGAATMSCFLCGKHRACSLMAPCPGQPRRYARCPVKV
jgi:hypothetical protein